MGPLRRGPKEGRTRDGSPETAGAVPGYSKGMLKNLKAASLSVLCLSALFAGRSFAAPVAEMTFEKYQQMAQQAQDKPEEAFDGKPSAFLQNYDLDSILNTTDSPNEPYRDMKGRPYRGLQPKSMDHPKTGALRSLGITVLTPVLTPLVTTAAYLSRPDDSPAKAGKGLKGLYDRFVHAASRVLAATVGAPLGGLVYGLFFTAVRAGQTVKRFWHSIAG